ncbi:nitrogen permease regulator 2-like protein [Dinothrombium tinctorium]|uniref:Nitrogen permease regulator 2-like protein n=1 Tax=Dinothrombium tinctorium TaxID=1965070 RepID=A0A3S3RSE4_9ACAR|nr:nitrogen permease regulator 2-like protein [Dinothrombium tinctorium]RWS04041.1 nitrogen permease regulator 2-like protein [Dinothrombium tinctorium]
MAVSLPSDCWQSNECDESPIQGIFFCEFHSIAGPKITFQVPEDYVSKDVFDSLSVYLIPKPELQGSLMTVNVNNMKIIGFPCGIEHEKYPRNRLLFNLCFVCVASMRTMQYEPIVKKLANYLVHLELECNFLFDENSKAKLPHLMAQIRNQLNKYRSCTLPVTESTTIHLKVNRVHPEPQQVEDHDVPIFSISEVSIIPSQWDLTTQQVLPYIDGYRHVDKIAAEADVEVSLVKACIQNMIYYGIITLIPIFQYSNVYVTTEKLIQLVENTVLRNECLQYVSIIDAHLPTFRSVFQLYSNMLPGVTVKELCTRFNPNAHGINEKKLVTFGVMKGLIRRLEKYPVLTQIDPHTISKQRGAYRFFDGKNSYDKICCKTNKSHKELDDLVNKHPSAVVIWK